MSTDTADTAQAPMPPRVLPPWGADVLSAVWPVR
jgi:hypothetical protein